MIKFIKLCTDILPLQASLSTYFVQFPAISNANMNFVDGSVRNGTTSPLKLDPQILCDNRFSAGVPLLLRGSYVGCKITILLSEICIWFSV
jgi:prepilin-type processing-associated H-X9-DG protein